MKKRSVTCHVCDASYKLKENEPDIAVCPCCGTDLTDTNAETRQNTIRCDHVKGTFSILPGNMYLTNMRLFWIKEKTNAFAMGGGLVGGLAAAINKNVGKVDINIFLDDMTIVEDFRKGVRSGITIRTKNGEAYSFLSNKLKEWKSLLVIAD